MRELHLRTTFSHLNSICAVQCVPPHSTHSQYQQCRNINKHFNPKWKRQRREKYLKTPLPDFDAFRRVVNEDMTPAEIRAFMRQKGIAPYLRASPAVVVTHSGEIKDPYVPKEGDGVLSSVTDKTVHGMHTLGKFFSKWNHKRKVRQHHHDFDDVKFIEEAENIYIEAHELLTKVFPRNFLSEYRDKEDYFRLHDLVTEHAYPDMAEGLEDKTLVWKYIAPLQRSRIVNVKAFEALLPGNMYGQITVRFHTKQIMALYDRFGRLMHGSETVPKDTIDYIVFERHISDTDGMWRLHAKIRPKWVVQKHTETSVPKRTYVIAEEEVKKEEDTN